MSPSAQKPTMFETVTTSPKDKGIYVTPDKQARGGGKEGRTERTLFLENRDLTLILVPN